MECVRLLPASAAIIALVAIAATAFRARVDRNGPVVTTPVAVASELDFAPSVIATGSVRLAAGARIDVGARASGVVRRLAVRQGSRVHRGDLIAELDDREVRLRLADATARVLDLAAATTQAEVELTRLRPLAAAGYASARDLEDSKTAVAQARARLASATAERDLAKVQLNYMTIRAPVDGVVASVTTHEGETVAASFTAPTFVTLIDLSRLECVALVDETDVGRVKVGESAEFSVDAYPGRVFTGEVIRIAPDATIVGGVVDYETTIRIRDDSTNRSSILRPQMTANVTIVGAPRRALVLPTIAVRQGGAGEYVWRRRGRQTVRVPVETGERRSDITQITSGLEKGDTVLTGNFPDSAS